MSKQEKYLTEIRELDGLNNAILYAVNVYQKENKVEFVLVTDTPYPQGTEEKAALVGGRYLPDGFSACVRVIKRTPDADVVRQKIYEFVSDRFPAAASFLEEKDIYVEMLSSGAQFCFSIPSGNQTLFESGKVLDEVSAYLKTIFCGAFYGTVKIVEKERDDTILYEKPVYEEETLTSEIRFFDVEDFHKIDGATPVPQKAVYAADLSQTKDTVAVCGKIIYIEEKTYVKTNEKTGEEVQKSRFSITINDGSGGVRTTYFPKKATLEKVRALQVGDYVVLTGNNEEFRGNISFKTDKLDIGRPPVGFVPVAKKSKPVPVSYKTVFPEKYIDYTQTDLFSRTIKVEDLSAHDFVVFDLETTGLIRQPSMGKMDKIIEVGAVKISGGEIIEKFSTFVACPDKLPPKIIELTGICDADLVGAPPIEQVIADFFKFCDGCLLVGHNVNFDYDFVSHYAEQEGYYFSQSKYDTIALAQDVLRGVGLSNYKLDTVAGHYGFLFQHHRAFDDALVTAKIFIELIKQKGKLPY